MHHLLMPAQNDEALVQDDPLFWANRRPDGWDEALVVQFAGIPNGGFNGLAQPDIEIKNEIGDSSSPEDEDSMTMSWQYPQSASPKVPNPVRDTPYFDILLERFVDNFAPSSQNCGHANSLRVAAEASIFSPLLKHAFLAASTLYFGYCVKDMRFVDASQVIYTQFLSHLQRALDHPEQVRTEGVLAAVCVAMAFESLRSTSMDGLLVHCIGALQLIEFRGPYSHKTGIEHVIFTEFLPYLVTAAIYIRKPIFLAREEWKTIPWSASDVSKDIMDALMEHMVDIPAILHQADEFERGNLDDAAQSSLWSKIKQVEFRLQKWKFEWADNYPSGPVLEADFQSEESFPVFQYVDQSGRELITPLPLVYPDPQLARVLCFYYAAMILLCSADKRSSQANLRFKRYSFAMMICRSMKYFMNSVPGNMVNRMMLPLSVASAELPEGSIERAFVLDVSRMIETKGRLNSWAAIMELSRQNLRMDTESG